MKIDCRLEKASTVESSASQPAAEGSLPLVSIIISNYNYADYVGQAIESGLAQTYPNVEVIIVDDGSTDGSEAVIKAVSDPRLKCIFQANAGQAAAMNRGFAASKGEIVFFLDSDDMLSPGAAATIVQNWLPDISHIQFSLEAIDRDGKPLGLHFFCNQLEDGDVHWQLVVGGQYRFAPTSGNAFSRKALQRVLPMPEEEWRICADAYLTTMSPCSGAVVTLRNVLGSYRIHGLNNWYTEAVDDSKRQDIWQLHVRIWRALIGHLNVPPVEGWDVRQVRDAAALHLFKRVIIAEHRYPDWFAPRERWRSLAKALARLIGARVSLGNKLLYLGFLTLMAAGAYGWPKTRDWINHRSFRPARLGTFIEWLKGDDFYGWMRARPRPRGSAPAIELGKAVPFGRIGSARPHQWYGWTRLALYDDWCIGAEAALVFAAPETKETLVFEAQIRPALIGGIKTQYLKVLANDRPVFEGAITTKTVLSFQVPADAWRGRSEIVLRFQTPSFIVPRFIFEKGEGIRAQSIAFTWMRWSILSDPKQKAPSAPYLPVGVWIDAAEQGSRHLSEGWRRTSDGLVRMERRTARLLASVLEPAAGDHVLSLEFEKEKSLQRSPLAVVTGAMVQSQLDLAQQSRLDMVLRRGYIPGTGALTVDFHSNAIVGPAVRQLDGEGPAGPALRRMRLLQIDGVAKRAVFQPGQPLDFRAGGTGAAYLGVGWHRPEEIGTLSSDVVAELNGLWIDRDSEIFITALLQPGASDGPLSTSVVRIRAGDVLLARYVIDGPSELTAIMPASLVGEDRLLTLKFETDALLRPSDFGDVSESRAVGVVLRSLVLS